MPDKTGLILIVAVIQVSVGNLHLRREWVPQSMTAAEMWNPYTWYYPHATAAAESWAEYFKKAQEVNNQLYQQWHATGAQWGWWSNGQSQYVPGGGAGGGGGGGGGGVPGGVGDPTQGTGQAPGVNGKNQDGGEQTPQPNQGTTTQTAGPDQGTTTPAPQPAGQDQGATTPAPQPAGQDQGNTSQTTQPGGQNQGATQNAQPTGQYVPNRTRRFIR